jgi:hypothetical protein
MPVAVAGRISMSIPVFFRAVNYDIGKGQTTWVDGGVGSNLPSEVVFGQMNEDSRDYGETRARTMMMTFDEKGRGYTVLHGREKKRYEQAGIVEKKLSGNPKYQKVLNEDADKIYAGGPNSVVVFHGNIDTTDLGASKERKDFATLLSQMKSLELINARQNQAYHEVFPSVFDAFRTLSGAEINQIRDGGEPDEPSNLERFNPRSVAKQFYSLAAQFSVAQAEAGATFETLSPDEKVHIRRQGEPKPEMDYDPARLLLAPHLQDDELEFAVGEARDIQDERARAQAFAGLLPHLDKAESDSLVRHRDGIVHSLTNMVATSKDDKTFAQALVGVARYLSQTNLEDVALKARSLKDDGARAQALEALRTRGVIT